MENTIMFSKGFAELSNDEMVCVDGGFVILGATITLTLGAKVGIACFGVGLVGGLIFA